MNKQTFDINHVQKDIERALTEMPPIEYAQPRIRNKVIDNEQLPIVDYTGGNEEVPAYLPLTDNLSAVNVASQYESAAKEVEAMGEALKEVAQRAEAMAAKVNEAIKYIKETAAAYRAEASLIFERIEKVDKLSANVIAVCEDLRNRIKE